jgi:hypothetical protein
MLTPLRWLGRRKFWPALTLTGWPRLLPYTYLTRAHRPFKRLKSRGRLRLTLMRYDFTSAYYFLFVSQGPTHHIVLGS